MEFVLTEEDSSTLVKWDKEKNLLKTFNPQQYRIVSEKEYQALKELERNSKPHTHKWEAKNDLDPYTCSDCGAMMSHYEDHPKPGMHV